MPWRGRLLWIPGSIRLQDQDITRWPEHRRAKLIGRVFQNPFSGTAAHMSIAENLALAARRGMGRGVGWALNRKLTASFRDRVRQLNMGLEDRLDNAIGSLVRGPAAGLDPDYGDLVEAPPAAAR